MKHQIWGFTYISGYDNINVLTNTKEEYDGEYEIPCFDGLAYFKIDGRYYVMHYPTYKSLTKEQKDIIEDYCGYKPNKGEYGVICGALGTASEISESVFNSLCVSYPLTIKSRKYLNY